MKDPYKNYNGKPIVNKIVNKPEAFTEVSEHIPSKKVTIQPEMADNDLIDELMASLIVKFGCHFSLSISRDGKARLAIHGNPTLIYRAESAAEVIDLALES